MKAFPEVKTERLILGQIRWTDIPTIVRYAGDREIASTTMNIPHPYQEKDAVFWINSANQGFQARTQYTFGIRLKATDAFIGGIGLRVHRRYNRAVLGYWIAKPFWNKGYATEAAAAMLYFGFATVGLNKIYATHLVENPASGKVMIKNGMIKEGELLEHYKKDDEYKSILQYRLTQTEFNEKKLEMKIH